LMLYTSLPRSFIGRSSLGLLADLELHRSRERGHSDQD
jgi:hypothetical protein